MARNSTKPTFVGLYGLTPVEARLVGVLVDHEEVTRSALLNKVYRGEPKPREKHLDLLMFNVRKKLPKSCVIATIWGRGYSLSRTGAAILLRKAEQNAA